MVKRDIYFQFKSDFNKAAGEQISMGDIINISGPKDIKGKISKILVFPNGINCPTSLTAIDILQLIREKLNNESISIHLIGDAKVLLEPKKQDTSSKLASYIKLVFALLLLFVGAGLAIMYFHSDVNMKEVHSQLYYLLSGEKNENPLIFSIPYSIGLGLGIAIFFKAFSRGEKKANPGPLELEFYQNKKELEDFLKNSGG